MIRIASSLLSFTRSPVLSMIRYTSIQPLSYSAGSIGPCKKFRSAEKVHSSPRKSVAAQMGSAIDDRFLECAIASAFVREADRSGSPRSCCEKRPRNQSCTNMVTWQNDDIGGWIWTQNWSREGDWLRHVSRLRKDIDAIATWHASGVP